MFSYILTPLPGMNIPFDIVKGKGPIIFDPISTADRCCSSEGIHSGRMGTVCWGGIDNFEKRGIVFHAFVVYV